jgi:hypothetical protein
MSDLVAFLRARLDEDEARARKAEDEWDAEWVSAEWQDLPDEVFAQARTYDPARVLREVEAQRAILDAYEWGKRRYDSREEMGDLAQDRHRAGEVFALLATIQTLAAVYRDHPDYRREWAP